MLDDVGLADEVALLAEGVDRNFLVAYRDDPGDESPSSRRAWIEICYSLLTPQPSGCRPPRGGRG